MLTVWYAKEHEIWPYDGDGEVEILRREDVIELLEQIRDICEDHRGDENYMPTGRLAEISRIINGEI